MRPCPRCGSSDARVRYVEEGLHVVECHACRLVYLANPPDENGLYEAYYAAPPVAPEQYRADASDAALRELYAINEQRIARVRSLQPTGALLDVGCGRGYFMATARTHGYRVRGIDVSEGAVRHAREAFGLDVRVQTLERLARTSEWFDVITLWHVLEHFLDPFAALGRIHGLLAPGGLCLVEVPNLRSLKFMLARQKWQGGNHPRYHRTFFTARTLRRALRESGFTRIRRLRLAYRVPGRRPSYELAKQALGAVALDAFLAFAAWK